jgi:hypothetical protein
MVAPDTLTHHFHAIYKGRPKEVVPHLGVSHDAIVKRPEKGIITYVVTGMNFSNASEISESGATIRHNENEKK